MSGGNDLEGGSDGATSSTKRGEGSAKSDAENPDDKSNKDELKRRRGRREAGRQ